MAWHLGITTFVYRLCTDTSFYWYGFSIVLGTWQIQVLFFGTFVDLKIHIFNPWWVESADAEPVYMEDQL